MEPKCCVFLQNLHFRHSYTKPNTYYDIKLKKKNLKRPTCKALANNIGYKSLQLFDNSICWMYYVYNEDIYSIQYK